jgi:hypothetical protein
MIRETINNLRMTTEGCPTQWYGNLEDGRQVYIRYRWGGLTLRVARSMDSLFDYDSNMYDLGDWGDSFDGCMETEKLISILSGYGCRVVEAGKTPGQCRYCGGTLRDSRGACLGCGSTSG